MKNTAQGCTYTELNPEKKIPPTIIFSRKSLKWIDTLIDIHETEVGFFGTVVERPNYTFYIDDIFYPKHQAANSATCEISPEGETELMNWLIAHDRVDDIGRMMLWGHSHHTMQVFASGQDDKQALERMANTHQHVIRVIVNKDRLMSVSFLDCKTNTKFDHIKWIEEPVDTTTISEKMVEDIKVVVLSDLPPADKMKKIDEIIYTDNELESIIEKAKALKEINIPKHTYPSYSSPHISHHYGGGTHAPAVIDTYRWKPRVYNKNEKVDVKQMDLLDNQQFDGPYNNGFENMMEMYEKTLTEFEKEQIDLQSKSVMEQWENSEISGGVK